MVAAFESDETASNYPHTNDVHLWEASGIVPILRQEMIVPRPIREVFPFFADAGNLERITPPELRFRILTPLPIEMKAGTLIDYRLRLFGLPVAWKTLISAWSPPAGFVDEQIRGPYREWIHTHTFEEIPGGTVIRDEVRYRLPLGFLGLPAQPLVRLQLHRIFAYRQQVTQQILGGSAES